MDIDLDIDLDADTEFSDDLIPAVDDIAIDLDIDIDIDDFGLEPIDFDDVEEDDFLTDNYVSIDYTDKLPKLLQHIRAAQNDIKKLESIKASEISLPLKRENYSFLDDNIFSIYVDIWKEAIQQGLPSKEELLETIYTIFQNIEYSLRLAKTAFEEAYFSDYKLVYNNILAARKKEEEKNTICTPEEQQKIQETISVLTAATTFFKHCDTLIRKMQC